MDKLLYGAAYYDEYMPYERCEKDAQMMVKAGMNVVRIAESTWSTEEPREGVFDFSHVTHVMDVMEKYGISVIIGTPTYAIPAWLAKKHPEILAETFQGKELYGRRQNMDITNPDYLKYAERVIRRLMEVTAGRPCVIGYQLDNETKHYDAAGPGVQAGFVEYLKEKFHGSCQEMNQAFGLDYWSNRIDDWEDFPDVRGTINWSLRSEFEKYRRSLVTKFIGWQEKIVRKYMREDQFITHNTDFDWRGFSFGVQPDVNHYQLAKHLDIAGCDIYHPSQKDLTGEEIGFGGDLCRSLKRDNYLVLETEAQGFPCWTPYPRQLRLQAYSHVASGANMVEYWHWHSIHNSFETYWKGVLSHDLEENAVCREASVIGNEWKRIGDHLVNLKKKNRAAFLLSNTSLTALSLFTINQKRGQEAYGYNEVFRSLYDCLFHLNISVDMIWEDEEELSAHLAEYDLVVVPALYAAQEKILEQLVDYVKKGGVLLATFKSGFCNENMKVFADLQPHVLREAIGASYQEFVFPDGEPHVKEFAELLMPEEGTQVLMNYENSAWEDYAAATLAQCGKGKAFYLASMPDEENLERILRMAVKEAGISVPAPFSPVEKGDGENCGCADEKNGKEVCGRSTEKNGIDRHTVAIRGGVNRYGKQVTLYLNYSALEQQGTYEGKDGIDLLGGRKIQTGEELVIAPWDLAVVEEQ